MRHFVVFREIVKPLVTGFSNSLQKAFKMLEDAEAYMKENQVMKYIKFLNKEHVKGAG